MSADSLGGVRCFGPDAHTLLWKTTLASADPVNKQAVTTVASAKDMDWVVCGMYQVLHVISTDRGQVLQSLEFPQWVNVCAMNQAADVMAVGGEEGTLWLFDKSATTQGSPSKGEMPPLAKGKSPAGSLKWKELKRFSPDLIKCDVQGLALHTQRNRLVSSGNDGCITVWDIATAAVIQRIATASQVTWVALDSQGDRLASCNHEGKLIIVSMTSLDVVAEGAYVRTYCVWPLAVVLAC